MSNMRKFNLSINKCRREEVELEDVSFENSLLRQLDFQRQNRSANSTLVVLDGTFSELMPMQDCEAMPGSSNNDQQLAQIPSGWEAAGPSTEQQLVRAGPSSERQSVQAGPSSCRDHQQEEQAGPSSRQDCYFVRPEEQPGSSSAMYSNITYEDEPEIEEAEEQFPMSQLSQIPDFRTAVTSTPRRELDEDGPILIDLDLLRRSMLNEKEHQRQQARQWYDEVRDCLQSKTRPYSRKLKERKGVLNQQIRKIKRQREALDQLLVSLERENRDVSAQIDYLESFIDNFPPLQTI